MDSNLLTEAMPKNLAPAPQEWKKQGLGVNEISLQTALSGSKISEAGYDDIITVLKLAMVKIGLRASNWPDEKELELLVHHILTKFGKLTCEEVNLAFDLAIDGQLMGEGKNGVLDANCYENFSCLYLSTIINGYRRWANRVYAFLPSEKYDEPKLLEEKKEFTDEEMQEWVDGWKKTIKAIENPVFIPHSFYEFLERKNILSLTKEQKIEYLQQAIVVRQHNLAEEVKYQGEHCEAVKLLEKFKAMNQAGCFEGREVGKLKDLARKIAVFDYLKNEANEAG